MPVSADAAIKRLKNVPAGAAGGLTRRNTGVRFSIDDLNILILELTALTNENGHTDPFFDSSRFPHATGVVFMLGKNPTPPNPGRVTIDILPIVGEDIISPPGTVPLITPKWDFIIHNGIYGYTNYDGSGGGGQKTPPPTV
jgi:hypothetical protein